MTALAEAVAKLRDYTPCLDPNQAIVDRQALHVVLDWIERLKP